MFTRRTCKSLQKKIDELQYVLKTDAVNFIIVHSKEEEDEVKSQEWEKFAHVCIVRMF